VFNRRYHPSVKHRSVLHLRPARVAKVTCMRGRVTALASPASFNRHYLRHIGRASFIFQGAIA
jgi:hypothetical protein